MGSECLIINLDIWEMIADLLPKEQCELLKCLSEYCHGVKDVACTSRMVKAVFKRIVIDNERDDFEDPNSLSAKRRRAALKRWYSGSQTYANNANGVQNGCKVYANNASDANDANTFCISKEEERTKEEEPIHNIDTIIKDSSLKDSSLTSNSNRKNRNPMLPKDALFDSEDVCEAWSEWVMMRAKLKKPLIGQAESRAVATLKRLSANNPEIAVKVLNQSTDGCWTGLYELKQDYKPKPKYDTSFGRPTDYDAMTRDMQYGGLR